MSDPETEVTIIVRFIAYNEAGERKYCNIACDPPKPSQEEIEEVIKQGMREHGLSHPEKIQILTVPTPAGRIRECAKARAKLRQVGEDYDTYDFEDFNLGPKLEALLDPLLDPGPDADPKGVIYHARAQGVIDLLRDSFDHMRSEGKWYIDTDGHFTWRPDIWVEFWHDEFPFTLDLRPEDLMSAVIEELDWTLPQDDENWDEDETDEALATFERGLMAWRDAIDQALAHLAEKRRR